MFDTSNLSVDNIQFQSRPIDILRLDQIHPIVSGNKIFKLKYFIEDAVAQNFLGVATFGGGYSNHLHATAFYCQQLGLKSMGFIRGNYSILTQTLKECMDFGMTMVWLNKIQYNESKRHPTLLCQEYPSYYFIPDGGYGVLGAKGMATIDTKILNAYKHIFLAVGTGTTMAGLINNSHATVTGVVMTKNNNNIENEIRTLLISPNKYFRLLHDYHFGGFAQTNLTLIHFIKKFYTQYRIKLDKVYTAKAMFALMTMIDHKKIAAEDTILFVHTGGIQGNGDIDFDDC